VRIVCVYRSGGDYDADYVARLASGVRRHLADPPTVICLTDRPEEVAAVPGVDRVVRLSRDWPGWWCKLEAFAIPGPALYFDLDTMFVGPLDPWIATFSGMTEPLGMIQDFYAPLTLQSGVMFWPGDALDLAGRLDAAFASGAARFRTNGRGTVSLLCGREVWGGDGPWIARQVGNAVRVINGQSPRRVVSYKVHVRGKGIPDNSCVVCFHGHPRPREAAGDPIVEEHWR
jgi:hypothetical protein